MFIENRDGRLAAINAVLDERGLRRLNKLGDHTKREIEILGIADGGIYDHSKTFFTDIKFDVVFPNGKKGAFTIRFNANGASGSDGAVMAVLVNGKFAIVKQWRPAETRWTYEFPRGFGGALEVAHAKSELGKLKISELPLQTMVRELGEEVMKPENITSITHLGKTFQNSGTDHVRPSNWLVQIQVPEALLTQKLRGTDPEIAEVQLWDLETVEKEIGGEHGKISDNHTLGVYLLASLHIRRLPRSI